MTRFSTLAFLMFAALVACLPVYPVVNPNEVDAGRSVFERGVAGRSGEHFNPQDQAASYAVVPHFQKRSFHDMPRGSPDTSQYAPEASQHGQSSSDDEFDDSHGNETEGKGGRAAAFRKRRMQLLAMLSAKRNLSLH